MPFLYVLVPAYLIGAIPCGLLLGRLAGKDIRQHGSGNIGATNVLRVCGWHYGAPALLLDALKGFAPAFWLPGLVAEDGATALLGALAAFAAVAGHTWPVYLRFRGGKGVATSAGAFLALMPAATGTAVAAFAVALLSTRYVSVASTCAAVTVVTAHHLLETEPYGAALPYTVLAWLVLLLVVVRHRANYSRLLAGTENRIGAARTSAPPEGADSP